MRACHLEKRGDMAFSSFFSISLSFFFLLFFLSGVWKYGTRKSCVRSCWFLFKEMVFFWNLGVVKVVSGIKGNREPVMFT